MLLQMKPKLNAYQARMAAKNAPMILPNAKFVTLDLQEKRENARLVKMAAKSVKMQTLKMVAHNAKINSIFTEDSVIHA